MLRLLNLPVIFVRYPGIVTIKQLIVGVVVASSSLALTWHRIQRPLSLRRDPVSLSTTKAGKSKHVIRRKHLASRHSKHTKTELASRDLFGRHPD